MAAESWQAKASEPSTKSRELLERAGECRELATKFRNTETKERMLKVAANYERMALKSAARELEIAELEDLVRNANRQ
jgi:hypothetical protein